MTFTSVSFFLFLPVVYLIFHYATGRWRLPILLIASYGFYLALNAPYLLVVLFVVTVISYVCGSRIASCENEAGRKRWLWFGCLSTLATLALLKYFPFFEAQAHNLLGLKGNFSSAVTSIGVSYFTFQSISYLADVYLEIEEPEHDFTRFAVYMAFFPKLLQGPIERAGDLLTQLRQPYRFDYDVMRSAMVLFAWGLFKKVAIADRLAPYADQVYNNVHEYSGISLIIATYAYALQIYFDFSAYTDMARGTGRMFGINLTENFNSPYLATSVADFWRRWHISFSRWILDYIFKPLQMGWRNWGQTGTAAALLVTFLVSGIWHGATWGFVIWGLLHGIYLAVSTYYRPYQKRLHKRLSIDRSRLLKWWQVFVTFNLVSFAWIFFRAGSLPDAWYVITNMLTTATGSGKLLSSGIFNMSALIASLVLYFMVVTLQRKVNGIVLFIKENLVFRWTLYYGLSLTILVFGNFGTSSFVYFRF